LSGGPTAGTAATQSPGTGIVTTCLLYYLTFISLRTTPLSYGWGCQRKSRWYDM